MVRRVFGPVGLAAVVALLWATSVAVPSIQAQSASGSSLDQLLVEVRQLRAELRQIVNSSTRAQLFVARLQLQEQRVNTAVRQLQDVQNQLIAGREQQANVRRRLAAVEEGQRELPLEDRSDDMIRALRMQLEQGQAREEALRSQEATLITAVTTEQARWTEFNDKLDALERSLSSDASR